MLPVLSDESLQQPHEARSKCSAEFIDQETGAQGGCKSSSRLCSCQGWSRDSNSHHLAPEFTFVTTVPHCLPIRLLWKHCPQLSISRWEDTFTGTALREFKALLFLFKFCLDEGGEAGNDIAILKYIETLWIPMLGWAWIGIEKPQFCMWNVQLDLVSALAWVAGDRWYRVWKFNLWVKVAGVQIPATYLILSTLLNYPIQFLILK